MTRVVAILTETAGWVEDGARELPDDDQGLLLVGELVNSLLSVPVTVPGNATPVEVVAKISEAISAPTFRTLAAFAAAFHELAAEHDRHDPEVTSSDVLRALALRVSSPEV